ncbi:MAG: radical SAM protein [Candidatus Nanoarchaeia archaeon]
MAGAIGGTALLKLNLDGDLNGGIHMGGAIAGTSVLKLNQEKENSSLELVTLTVNNLCNMACPHCYLEYDGKGDYASSELIDLVLNGTFKHLAIVGKEPLFNRSHAAKTEALARKTVDLGKTVSIITNGANLHYLENPATFSFIDVSIDGGRDSYFRKGDYAKLINNVNGAISAGVEVNALHTLYAENLKYVSDMVNVSRDAQFNLVMFSPYLITENYGTNSVNPVSIESVLQNLSRNKEFMSAENVLLNLDIFHAEQNKLTKQQVNDIVNKYDLASKTVFFDELSDKIVRVTYDGLIMTPRDSLNPAIYHAHKKLIGNLNMEHGSLIK